MHTPGNAVSEILISFFLKFLCHSWFVRHFSVKFYSGLNQLKICETKEILLRKHCPPLLWWHIFLVNIPSNTIIHRTDTYKQVSELVQCGIISLCSSHCVILRTSLWTSTFNPSWDCVSWTRQLPIWRRGDIQLCWRIWSFWTSIYEMCRRNLVPATSLHKYNFIFTLCVIDFFNSSYMWHK